MRALLLATLLAIGCGTVPSASPDARVDSPVSGNDDASVDAGPTCVPNPAGLRARYRAEDNPNDHTGTFNGATVGANFVYTAGKYGKAFQFDGADDTVTINDSDQLWPQGSFTLEAWVKPLATSTGYIIAKNACGSVCPASAFAYFGLRLESGGHPQFEFHPDAGVGQNVSVLAATSAINDNNWHHLVGVKDSNSLIATLYVDGAVAASASGTATQFGPMTNADASLDLVTFGSKMTNNADSYEGYFFGAIDEVAIYHSALTAAQVSAMYSAPEGKCL